MIAVAWGALVLAVGCIFVVLKDLINDEIRGWLELLPHAILRLAAALLFEPGKRETIYQEEWLSELTYILRKTESRPITRLVTGVRFAMGLLISARRIARRVNRHQIDASGAAPHDRDLELVITNVDGTVRMASIAAAEIHLRDRDTVHPLNLNRQIRTDAHEAARRILDQMGPETRSRLGFGKQRLSADRPGVTHRSVQTCHQGHQFFWQPSPGICPYCSLTPEARAVGLRSSGSSPSCPPGCCPA
jgi:hypothetical protein